MPARTQVGSVTRQRYDELVAEGRRLVLDETKIQFIIGDDALEIGAAPKLGRFPAGRWPGEHHAEGVSFEIHRILEQLGDRFGRTLNPPPHPRTGKFQWSGDAARRQVGWQLDTPRSVQEKVEAIHDLAQDEQVAAQVTTDFLHRPDVAFRAAGDRTARHLFNKAQSGRARQHEDDEHVVPPREEPPVIRSIDRALEFLDMVGACHKFVASTGRLVPLLWGRELPQDSREVILTNPSRVRAVCDWAEHAVSTGETDMDEELARLLRDE